MYKDGGGGGAIRDALAPRGWAYLCEPPPTRSPSRRPTALALVALAVAGQGAAAGNDTPDASAGAASNIEAIGNALYTDYAYFFEAAGLVLLVAMIGAIVLTLRHKPHVKRQDIGKQVARTPATGTHNVSIKPGSGIDL